MSSVNIFPQVDTAQISSYEPNKVFGSCKDMYLGRIDSNTVFRMLFKFPTVWIPDQCVILKAILKIYVQFGGMLITSSFSPYALMEDWDIQTITWTHQPLFNPTLSGEKKSIKRSGFYSFNITKLVTKWYQNEIINYGLILKNEELTDGTYKRVNTIIHSNLAPMLEITYTQKSEINLLPSRYISKIEEIDTDGFYSFSSTVNASLTKTITCHIENLGKKPVEIKFQSSPNSIDFCDVSSETTLIKPGQLIWTTPYCFSPYGRIAVKNVNPKEISKIKIWYSAQE
ncbi:MAG: DNRLRE domain-containing protein [Marinisporobacter sp.]|jgi:hypothetical protein|nr:DNRLRE domain-containing protein [Marinisporobacter sp.]